MRRPIAQSGFRSATIQDLENSLVPSFLCLLLNNGRIQTRAFIKSQSKPEIELKAGAPRSSIH